MEAKRCFSNFRGSRENLETVGNVLQSRQLPRVDFAFDIAFDIENLQILRMLKLGSKNIILRPFRARNALAGCGYVSFRNFSMLRKKHGKIQCRRFRITRRQVSDVVRQLRSICVCQPMHKQIL